MGSILILTITLSSQIMDFTQICWDNSMPKPQPFALWAYRYKTHHKCGLYIYLYDLCHQMSHIL